MTLSPPLVEAPAVPSCVGDPPLTARWEDWMVDLLADPRRCERLVELHGSPLHLHHTTAFDRNVKRILDASDADLRVFFARKANKCMSYVEAAAQSGIGVDVAGHEELRQTLDAGVDPRDIIVTAAVKPRELVDLAISSGVLVAIDNDDEAERMRAACRRLGSAARVAVRLAFRDRGSGHLSRFGFPVEEAHASVLRWHRDDPNLFAVEGLHFHLDGYAAADRVHAIDTAVQLADRLEESGAAAVEFIDMGGGFPMSYLDDQREWDRFWNELEGAVLGDREHLTYRGYGFGLKRAGDQVIGARQAYPHAQQPTGAAWLRSIVEGSLPSDRATVAKALARRGIRLHCEPGRALLDGCGMTLARVEHRKTVDGDTLIGLAMNSTNCRSQKSQLLADPVLVRGGEPSQTTPVAGYLAGAYCSEGDIVMHRRLHFPRGVEVGDLIAFPNTAGYLMHFTESRSHQFALPLNVDVTRGQAQLDGCDRGR